MGSLTLGFNEPLERGDEYIVEAHKFFFASQIEVGRDK